LTQHTGSNHTTIIKPAELLLTADRYSFRSWLDDDDEIMMDMATCAMAFRLLRMHGYDVSSGKPRTRGGVP
jgi:hypothetical protein